MYKSVPYVLHVEALHGKKANIKVGLKEACAPSKSTAGVVVIVLIVSACFFGIVSILVDRIRVQYEVFPIAGNTGSQDAHLLA
jgi:hypothetical protein